MAQPVAHNPTRSIHYVYFSIYGGVEVESNITELKVWATTMVDPKKAVLWQIGIDVLFLTGNFLYRVKLRKNHHKIHDFKLCLNISIQITTTGYLIFPQMQWHKIDPFLKGQTDVGDNPAPVNAPKHVVRKYSTEYFKFGITMAAVSRELNIRRVD